MINYFVMQQQAANPLITMLPLILMMGALWFFMMRPQRKREKELREQIKAMKVGDKILTIGGVVGRVMNINNDEVTIASSAANSLLTFKVSAISQVYLSEEAKAAAAAAAEAKAKDKAKDKK